MLHCFIPTGQCLYFVTSLNGSSLLGMVYMVSRHASLGMVCVVSRHVSLVHHYLAWFVLFNFMLHWLFITGHGFFV
jgi:hypothetical protein